MTTASNTDGHVSVLYEEALSALNIKTDGIYIDATFGRGGHTRGILNALGPNGRVYAFDQDPDAAIIASELQATDSRFHFAQTSFADLKETVHAWGIQQKVDGLLMDLGVSSPQIDTNTRGFSFSQAGPLDMRMNPNEGVSAGEWLTQAKAEDIAHVLKTYGEERFAKKIANAIVSAREEQALTNTVQLANIIKAAHPRWEKRIHPATRSFQAIRIYINNELGCLEKALDDSVDCFAPAGRLVVISFHSLEDRIVKQFIRRESIGQQEVPREIPLTASSILGRMHAVGRVLTPTQSEVTRNPRARSAKMRIGEKVS